MADANEVERLRNDLDVERDGREDDGRKYVKWMNEKNEQIDAIRGRLLTLRNNRITELREECWREDAIRCDRYLHGLTEAWHEATAIAARSFEPLAVESGITNADRAAAIAMLQAAETDIPAIVPLEEGDFNSLAIEFVTKHFAAHRAASFVAANRLRQGVPLGADS